MESKLPLVSVIIPCYNVEDYINECLTSVFEQTYTNTEVICIDNNSTDTTWFKLGKWKDKYPDIIIDKELLKGACAARNKGMSLSSGEFFQFLDAYYILLKNKIKNQVTLLKKQEDCSLVVGASKYKRVDGGIDIVNPEQENIFNSLFIGKLVNTCSNLWNASKLKEIGGWSENLYSSQEADLMFRLLVKYPCVVFDNEYNTIIQERPFGQITKNPNMEGNYIRYLDIRLQIIEYMKKESVNVDDYYQLLFPKIREFYELNKELAVEYLKTKFPKAFLPSTQFGNSKSYQILFKIFGFKGTEKIKRGLSKLA